MNTNAQVKAITFSNSKFNGLFQGILLGTDVVTNGPTGVRIMGNMFDNIYAEGIIFGGYSNLNASGHNIFYDVGNSGAGITNPTSLRQRETPREGVDRSGQVLLTVFSMDLVCG